MKARKLESHAESIKRKDLKGLKLTEWDKENIRKLVVFFDKAFPGIILDIAKQARAETMAVARQKTQADPLNFTRRMAIPDGLWHEIKRAYPSILIDRSQFEQFLKWFPIFDVLAR